LIDRRFAAKDKATNKRSDYATANHSQRKWDQKPGRISAETWVKKNEFRTEPPTAERSSNYKQRVTNRAPNRETKSFHLSKQITPAITGRAKGIDRSKVQGTTRHA